MAKFYCPTKLSENISETPEGYLLCKNVPIARTGVMEYGEGETPLEVGDDGIVYVSREPSEVFRPQTIASFEGKSVTIKHPEEFVSPANWKMLTKGTVQNVRKSEEKDEDGEECLLADLLITDEFAIQLVKNGLREVSCGYEAEYEQTGKGKGRQTDIVGNHLALVEEGRAGSTYAIQDHKGRKQMATKLGDKLKKLFSQTVDEMMDEDKKKAAKAGSKTKIKDKKAKSKDGEGSVEEKVPGKSETNTVFDSDAYDELKGMMDAMGEKLEAMKPKAADDDEEEEKEDKSEDDDEEEEKEDKSEDDGEDTEILERVKALEAAVAKLLESKDEGESEDEEEEESEDDDEEEKEDKSEDDDEEEKSEDEEGIEGEEKEKKTGDAARAEILAPGFKAPKDGKNLRRLALKAALKDEDSVEVLKKLSGGKKPTLDTKEQVNTLFMAASEVLRIQRKSKLAGTKSTDSKPITFDSLEMNLGTEEMTPEKLNELHAKHYENLAKSQKN